MTSLRRHLRLFVLYFSQYAKARLEYRLDFFSSVFASFLGTAAAFGFLLIVFSRVPAVRGKVGRPRRRPERVTADRGYDHDKYRRELRRRGIASEIARRQTADGSGLGRARWVVERTFAWLHQFKRLLVRYDRRAEIHEAFLAIGCCLVCLRKLRCSF